MFFMLPQENKTVNFTSHLPWGQFVEPLTGIFVCLHTPNSFLSLPTLLSLKQTLDVLVKKLWKSGKISRVVHKKAISKQQVEKLFQSGELGPADTKDPEQLQRTVWFYLGIYFGRRGRENQQDMKPAMLAVRATPQGEEHYLSHLNSKLDCLFQRLREVRSFKSGEDKVWYCNSPLGVKIVD